MLKKIATFKAQIFHTLQLILCSTLAASFLVACGGAQEEISENIPPSAAFSSDTSTGIAPITIAFNASSSSDEDGSIVRYEWDFGDGFTDVGSSVQHNFSSEGSYLVVLTVTDDDGAQDSVSQEVVVTEGNWEPVADIAVSSERGIVPLEVSFSAQNSYDIDGDIVSYQWRFDGQTRSGDSLMRTFRQPGNYLVELEVEDNEGAISSKQIEIVALAEDATFSLSGHITALPYNDVDGDVNDPFAPYFNNDGSSEDNFQAVSNPVLLNGFATSTGTIVAGDRFFDTSDISDVYDVTLKAGDYVSLRVVNYAYADLDLYLYPYTPVAHGVIASSTGYGEYESFQITQTGRYLVEVRAHSGDSMYLMKIGSSSFVSGTQSVGQSGDFEPFEAMVKFKDANHGNQLGTEKQLPSGFSVQSDQEPQVAALASKAQLKLSHHSRKRVALAKMNQVNPQTFDALKLQQAPAGFDAYLASSNPLAYKQAQTLRAIKAIRADQDVEYAEPNYKVQGFFTPTDPRYNLQWHYPVINLPHAWDTTLGSQDVVVAVIDSGIFSSHPDLVGQTVAGYDFISNAETALDGDGIDPDPEDPGDSTYVGNSSWHGTHVAGTIAAAMNNGEGGLGVAPEARVMPLRALGRGGGYSYDILQAVRYAAGLENDSGTVPSKSADIINMSLGGSGFSQTAQNIYNQVRAKGIFLVAAAGNEASNEPMYPASYAGVISVAAFDYLGEQAPYSNYGEYIDVAAPGGNMYRDRNGDGYYDGVLSAVVNDSSGSKLPSYAFYQGTSMAAPHISGILALMKSVYPQLTPDEFDSLLVNGKISVDKGALGRDDEYGYGNIDAFLAVQAAQELADGGSTVALVPNPGSVYLHSTENEKVFSLRQIGNGDIGVTSIEVDEDWLTVSALSLSNLEELFYKAEVDRSNLNDGYYKGHILITTSTGSQITLTVTMEVGDPQSVGNAGLLYTLLINPDTLTTLASYSSTAENGVYTYQFSNIPIGDYYIATSSDVDNDTYVCTLGESCGFYPAIGEVGVLRLDDNKTDVDFAAGLFTNLETSSSSTKTKDKIFNRIPEGF